jgi:small subunit ribosomal protein S16
VRADAAGDGNAIRGELPTGKASGLTLRVSVSTIRALVIKQIMIAIKLRPVGKKKQISYRVAVMEKKSKLVGKFIEDLGWYNPHTNKFGINAQRATHWIGVGAQPTDTVHNILVDAKIVVGAKIAVHKKSKHPAEPAVVAQESQSAVAEESAPESAVIAPESEVLAEPVIETSEPAAE